MATLFARTDHRDVDLRELARVLSQRPGKAGAGVDLGAQGGNQVALLFVFSLVGERGQRAFQRQARRNQSGNLAGPDGQFRGIEHAGCKKTTLGVGACSIGGSVKHRLDFQRNQGLCAQLAAGRLDGLGLHDALAGLSLGVKRFKRVGRHGRSDVFSRASPEPALRGW
jgi:hypothetical protein